MIMVIVMIMVMMVVVMMMMVMMRKGRRRRRHRDDFQMLPCHAMPGPTFFSSAIGQLSNKTKQKNRESHRRCA